MAYTNREVFPAAPLALVATEVRFNDAPRLRRQETLDSIAIALESRFPVVEPQEHTNVRVDVTPESAPQIEVTRGLLLKNVQATAAFGLFPTRMTFETTAYTEFKDFLADFRTCCQAVGDAGVQPAIERVGLRYIDEIRVPATVNDARDWSEWIDSRLIDHLNIGPADTAMSMTTQGILSYELGDRRGLNFRFAALKKGAVVTPISLIRPEYPDGPFFVLDFDGFEDFTGPNATLLSAEVVGSALEAVHDPAGATFQSAITEKARVLFRTRTI